VPAPAVIPALVAYINTVVVKTLVVDLRTVGLDSVLVCSHVIPCYNGVAESISGILGIFPHGFYPVGVQVWVLACSPILANSSLLVKALWYNCKQIRVLKAGIVNGDLSSDLLE
jgi:hypothetical protein